MADKIAEGAVQGPIPIPPGGFAEPDDDHPNLMNSVGFVMLGFALMAVIFAVALVVGMAPVPALLVAWVGSIGAVLLLAAIVVWRETAASTGPDLATLVEWEADLKAELQRAQQIAQWDDDRFADDLADDATPDKRQA